MKTVLNIAVIYFPIVLCIETALVLMIRGFNNQLIGFLNESKADSDEQILSHDEEQDIHEDNEKLFARLFPNIEKKENYFTNAYALNISTDSSTQDKACYHRALTLLEKTNAALQEVNTCSDIIYRITQITYQGKNDHQSRITEILKLINKDRSIYNLIPKIATITMGTIDAIAITSVLTCLAINQKILFTGILFTQAPILGLCILATLAASLLNHVFAYIRLSSPSNNDTIKAPVDTGDKRFDALQPVTSIQAC